jgi:hypothetical protein
MLSYITPSMQPQLSSSDSAIGICSISSEEGNKSSYPNEDDHDGLWNASRIYHHKSPIPFVYPHPSTPTYNFGFSFYDEMSPFNGNKKQTFLFTEIFEYLLNRCNSITVCIYSYNKTV